ncbi:bifunctional riboflavin kinase/FAD synthetase [Streptococcus halotolerans]|uniref:bifunctional riboflavin kinase/FAD synthetase n=1 Tax=Streptococcus halotolerans TaxID=1814128 RepID=UPI0007876287|nr:bifunctional riboflavin kinase/FAD synthetase [Streptococcus halotolerans]
MKIKTIHSYQEINEAEKTVLVLGYFDGLHQGHKALFEQAKKIANQKDLKVIVLTFVESPKLAFSRYTPDLLLHITSPQKRYEKFEEYGVDTLYLTDFTSDFAKVTSDQFIDTYIRQLNPDSIVVGFDYHFGHNRTNADYLSRNFEGNVVTVAEVTDGKQKISSTLIRELIQEGNVREANKLLGYEFSTRGIVVHGDARGRTIGFPTANLAPIDRTHIPSDGVYVTDVLVKGKRYRSMTSIGKNVTFGGTEMRLEVNIFDFSGDIYGEEIEIFWLEKIREMEKFNGIDDLVDQLKSDQEIAINWQKP